MASVSFSVPILGREYQIGCPAEEEDSLRKAARHLSQQMEEMKNRSPSIPYDKLAVLAALNMTHDFLKKSNEATTTETMSVREIKQLEKKIDNALVAVRQIEI
jgi:cell division protein ZapA